MSDYDDNTYCDFCRSSLGQKWEHNGHEDWCPIVEIERLRKENDLRQKIVVNLSAALAEAEIEIEKLRPALEIIARGYVDEGGVRRDLENSWKLAREALGDN